MGLQAEIPADDLCELDCSRRVQVIYVEEVIIGKSGVERIVVVFDAVVTCSFLLRF